MISDTQDPQCACMFKLEGKSFTWLVDSGPILGSAQGLLNIAQAYFSVVEEPCGLSLGTLHSKHEL